jgi:hypothetical protein
MKRKTSLILFAFFACIVTHAQVNERVLELEWEEEKIDWNPNQTSPLSLPIFEGVSFDPSFSSLPYKRFRLPLNSQIANASLVIIEEKSKNGNWNANDEVAYPLRWFVRKERGKQFLIVDVLPYNQKKGNTVLSKFRIDYSIATNVVRSRKTSAFKSQSVLASGRWYKTAVREDGIFKISPQYLVDNGVNISGLSIGNIRVYGNGSGMLPEENMGFQIDDLAEIPVKAVDVNGNGAFDGSDYILFYAKGPHQWREENGEFKHSFNLYTEENYYYVGLDLGSATTIGSLAPVTAVPTSQSTTFDDRDFAERDLNKVVDSGKQWFEEKYEYTLSYNYGFNFPHLVTTEPVLMTCRAIARSSIDGTQMILRQAGQQRLSLNFPRIDVNSGSDFVNAQIGSASFVSPSPSISITATYNNSVNPAGVAWMDFIRLQLRRSLNMAGLQQLDFRDLRTVGAGEITEFTIQNAPSDVEVWDVSNLHQTASIPVSSSANEVKFVVQTDSLREFVALRGSSFSAPTWRGAVANQNLHALNVPELLIVYPRSLESSALRLADFHENVSGYDVHAVPLDEIYNEFGGGSPDLTAIKNFCRMFYSRSSPSAPFKYLTLFGDASYDYKDRLTNNTNLVPTWQSQSSFSLNSSFCTDDYYGFLDDNEGGVSISDLLDIGIGRLTVRNLNEANSLVDKIIRYSSSPTTLGDWRTSILFAADDVDESWEWQLMDAAEKAAQRASSQDKRFNQQKVYQDSYTQIISGGSQRYPEAREDFVRAIESGRLVAAYTGHGGEIGLASERVLQVPDLQGWTNFDRLSLFITITCEFTRYDDPKRVSAGEFGLLNSNGGFIALFSTQRVVYASRQTLDLTRDIFDTLFTRVAGERITLGDVIRAVKNNNGSGDKLKFSLFGDPAIPLAIPQLNVETTLVNGQDVQSGLDTVQALSRVEVKGRIVDIQGQPVTDFNGQILPVVYDKSVQRATLVNDGVGVPLPFEEQSSIIYKGTAEVVNGEFTFSFVVPLDISYQFGKGRITYYAENGQLDAAGSFEEFIVGGLDTTAEVDNVGPEISLFMNDEQFINGGITNENPAIFALLSDSSGINTIGRGIGHDILAIIDDDINNAIVLNEYYTANLNSFQAGRVLYDLNDLSEGPHSLKLRAWDVYNNPSETTVDFVVANSEELALRYVLNYPNPFTTYTEFHFEHNRAGQPLDVLIQVFSASGQIVKTIRKEIVPMGNRVTEISWNGLDDYGDPIGKGVYVYKLSVRSRTDFSQAEEYEKLVILR